MNIEREKREEVILVAGIAVRFRPDPSSGVKENVIDILTSSYEEKVLEGLEKG